MHVFLFDGTILWAERIEFSSDGKGIILDEGEYVKVADVIRIVNCT